jgi:hypothetical protein
MFVVLLAGCGETSARPDGSSGGGDAADASCSGACDNPIVGHSCTCDRTICLPPSAGQQMCGLNEPMQCLSGRWVLLSDVCLAACPRIPDDEMVLGGTCSTAAIRLNAAVGAAGCTFDGPTGCEVYRCVDDQWASSACVDGGALGLE